jgi:hypothetical protein
MTRHHADTCEAEADHDDSCQTATELARLRAFAEAVRDEFRCDIEGCGGDEPEDHVDDCWSCAAAQALGRTR